MMMAKLIIIQQMSFLLERRVNPHLLLMILDHPPINAESQTPLNRLTLLAKTRRFKDIQTQADALKDLKFASLAKSTFVLTQTSRQLRSSRARRRNSCRGTKYWISSKNWRKKARGRTPISTASTKRIHRSTS